MVADGWECRDCGATFNEPAHKWGRDEPEPYEYDVCPVCGSADVWEESLFDDPPLSCPQCGSEGQWQCIGEVAQPGGAWHWAYHCMACNFESSYAGHPEAT